MFRPSTIEHLFRFFTLTAWMAIATASKVNESSLSMIYGERPIWESV